MPHVDTWNYYGLENEIIRFCPAFPQAEINRYLYEDTTSLHSTQEWLEEQHLKVKEEPLQTLQC